MTAAHSIGFDFGTTNSVVARAQDDRCDLIEIDGPAGADPVFRSALCFWQDDAEQGGLGVAAGPWAIKEYLEFPEGSRFIQSFKSVAAAASFEHAFVFERRYRFEQLGQLFLSLMAKQGGINANDS